MTSAPPPYTPKTDSCDTYSSTSSAAANWRTTNYDPSVDEQIPIHGTEPPPSYIATVTQAIYDQPAPLYQANSYYGTERPPPYVATISQPGMGVTREEPYVDVPDYMCLAVVSPFCCLFSGLLSIVYASKARSMKYEGQFQTALTYSSYAKNLALWSICIGLCLLASLCFAAAIPRG